VGALYFNSCCNASCDVVLSNAVFSLTIVCRIYSYVEELFCSKFNFCCFCIFKNCESNLYDVAAFSKIIAVNAVCSVEDDCAGSVGVSCSSAKYRILYVFNALELENICIVSNFCVDSCYEMSLVAILNFFLVSS
jgi:hypothetical protein